MSIVFIDGFETGVNAASPKWSISTALTIVSTAPTPRTGAVCGKLSGTNDARKTTPLASKLTVGVAFQRSTSSSYVGLVFTADGGTVQHVTVIVGPSGNIELRRAGYPGTLLATGNVYIEPSTWYYLEASCTLSDTVGTIDVQLNGTVQSFVRADNATVVTQYIGDTKNGGTSTQVDGFRIMTNNTGYSGFDDIYAVTNDGTAPIGFLGDCRVETLFPNAAGTLTQFTPTSGANYTNVDEVQANTTDVVTSDVLNAIDMYNFTNLVADPATAVLGVGITAYASKSDSGARALRLQTGTAVAQYDVGAETALATGYAHIGTILTKNPATTNDWTVAEINASEFGVKVR